MNKQKSYFDFKCMAMAYKIRDIVRPRINILNEIQIQPGMNVLDFGCGPASYTGLLSELVGSEGKVYAVDMHPLALRYVSKTIRRKSLENVVVVESDGKTFLADESIDVVIFYDVLHGLENLDGVLIELHRVLKSAGRLSVNDHHIQEQIIIQQIIDLGLFSFYRMGDYTLTFKKVSGEENGN